LIDDIKMSKSLGNVIKPLDLANEYGSDSLRYYLMRNMVLGQDATFTLDSFIKRYNADLANDYGNVIKRVTILITKYFDSKVPAPGEYNSIDKNLINEYKNVSSKISKYLEELKIHGKVDRGWLGVVIQAINPEIADSLKLDSTRGALVAEVVVDGPAFKAGLKRGDIILSINDKQIKNAEDLPREVGKLKPQEPAKLKVLRGRKQITINVRLGELLI